MNHRAEAINTYRRMVDRFGSVSGFGRLRGSKYVIVSGLQMLQLRIPRSSARGPILVNLDCALIDRRCYLRRVRKANP